MFELFDEDQDMGGLLIDGQSDPNLYRDYPTRSNLLIEMNHFIVVNRIVDFVASKNIPKDIVAIKLDIDSFECDILEALLTANYTFMLIHIEINMVFPPPIRFKVNVLDNDEFVPSIWGTESVFYGCSLSTVQDLLLPAGYVLLEVDGWDATFIRSSLAHLFEPLPVDGNTAFHAGFMSRFHLHPECFKHPKLQHPEIWRLTELIRFSDEAAHAEIVDEIRNHIEAIVPRNAANVKAPYVLSSSGPSDLYYPPR